LKLNFIGGGGGGNYLLYKELAKINSELANVEEELFLIQLAKFMLIG
jgi:hypothetical protein